jgi:hypothetical protein
MATTTSPRQSGTSEAGSEQSNGDQTGGPLPHVLSAAADIDLGMSDEAVERGTGKRWAAWFDLLDAWGAAQRPHREIAAFLHQSHRVPGWWAQGVTVGYERARGRRAVNERPDGFTVSVSKTFPTPIDCRSAHFADEELRNRWLEPGTLRLRTVQPGRSARFDVVADGTRLNVWFIAKGETKATVQLQFEHLPTAADIEPVRSAWKAHLARLAHSLSATSLEVGG